MLILDTCVLPQMGVSLDHPPQRALAVLADRAGHKVALPRMVLEESTQRVRAEADAALQQIRTAVKRVRGLFRWQVDLPATTAEDVAQSWRNLLIERFAVVEAPPGAAEEALLREAHRRLPAREGKGLGTRPSG